MTERVRTIRRAALVVVASASVVFSLAVVWLVITPAAIEQVTTWHLLGLFGLLMLPGVTLGAIELDRRAARRAAAARQEPPRVLPRFHPPDAAESDEADRTAAHRRRSQHAPQR